MTSRQYLRQLSRIQQNIRILSEEIERRKTKLTSTTVSASADRVQTSTSGDRFADMIAALADKELEQERLLYIYQTLRAQIVNQIQALDNPLYIIVLYKHYVEEKRLTVIAEETHYSYPSVKRIHSKALISFSEKYHNELI